MDGPLAYGLLASGMVLLSLVSPFAGLVAYMGILYLRPQELIPELAEMNPTRTAAIILLLAVALRMVIGNIRPAVPREMRPLLAFLAVIVASGAWGCWVCSEWAVEGMVKNAIGFWLIVTLVNTESRLRRFLWVLLAFQALMAAHTLQAYVALQDAGLDPELDPDEVRLGAFTGGYFGGAGDFAAMTNILVPFALVFALRERGFVRRVAALGLLGVLVGGVVATHARGAGVIALGVAVGACAILASAGMRGPGRLVPLAVAAALIAAIVLMAPAEFLERAASILQYREEEAADDRILFWKIGIRMFLDHPLLGVGAGQYSAHFWEYGGPRWMGWRASHNMFIDLVSQLGIAGIAAFGCLALWVGRGLWRARRRLDPQDAGDRFLFTASSAIVASLLTYFAAGMFQSILYYPMLYVHLAVAVAATGLIELRHPALEASRATVRTGARPEAAWSP